MRRYLTVLAAGWCLLLVACSGKSIQGVTASTSPNADTLGELRVLSYNIHHANPPSKPNLIDLQAIANVIKSSKANVVALQEVDVYTDRSGKNVHQANALAELTGMKAHFAKGIDYQGGEYGVAVLSKLPMTGFTNNPLPTAAGTNGEPRTMGLVILTTTSGKKVQFAFTHLDAQSNGTNRLLQINKIVELLAPSELPVIIAGDLNAVPGSEPINILDQHFTRTCISSCGFTIPVMNPSKTIDFVAFKPATMFEVLEHSVINETYASDHLPVNTRLRLK